MIVEEMESVLYSLPVLHSPINAWKMLLALLDFTANLLEAPWELVPLHPTHRFLAILQTGMLIVLSMEVHLSACVTR